MVERNLRLRLIQLEGGHGLPVRGRALAGRPHLVPEVGEAVRRKNVPATGRHPRKWRLFWQRSETLNWFWN